MPEMKTFVINGTKYEVVDETARNSIDGLTPAKIGAAPAGFGLGDMLAEQPIIADAHDIWKTGWYRVHPSVTANAPVSGVLRAEVYAYRYVTLTLYSNEYLSNDTTILRQCLVDGVWQDWEFYNPPMRLGVEYRTTKRYNGMPVYTMLVDCGNMPDGNTYKSVDVYCYYTGVVKPISCEGQTSLHGVVPIKYVDSNEQWMSATKGDYDGHIKIDMWGGVATWTATALVEYVKL